MNLNELILEIKKIFENKYDNILSLLLDLIEEYEHTDWKDYVEWNEDKFNKKTVYQDDNFEIVIISWKIYQETRVHDHPEKGCVMRVLEGSLIETEYLNVAGIQKMSSNIMHKDDINWKRGKKLLHKICALKNSISMHIYCPSKYVTKYYD